MIYLEIFYTFLKIGAFTFGGGYAMIPLIQSEMLNKNWISMERLIDFIAISESTPGPFAINISTYVGAETGGIFGAFCATCGVVLPSFIVILIVQKFFTAFKKSKIVSGIMTGLKPVVIGLIGAAVISAGKVIFLPNNESAPFPLICSASIFAVMLFLGLKKTNPIAIIIFSAVLGIIFGYAMEFLNS